MANFILSCRPSSYGKFRLHSYEHLSEIGIKHVEIDIPKTETAADIQLDMLDELGLTSLSLCFPINIDDKKIIEKFEKSLPIIKKMKPKYIFSSVKKKHEKDLEEGYAVLSKLGNIAKEMGIFISVETHPPYNSNGDVGKKTMENVNHPNVKINFDTANIYFYNKDIDAKEELKKILPWLGSVHLKDSMKRYYDWAFPSIGGGKIDFPGLLNILNELNTEIPLTLEIEGEKGEKLDLSETLNRVKKSADYLRSLNFNIK